MRRAKTLIAPTSSGLAQEASMISTLSSALSMQSSSHTDMDRLFSKRRFSSSFIRLLSPCHVFALSSVQGTK
jgi:hypothetical protein